MKLNNTWKVVIWGHQLHTHTHSYIHAAFVKAFKHLELNVFWHDDDMIIENFDYKNTLFITEGQVDKNIPIRDDCFYVLHNCNGGKYKHIFDRKMAIALQVYTNDVLNHGAEKINECQYFDVKGQIIYQTWGSDLLPEEIERNKINIGNQVNDEINWVGSIGLGEFGNTSKLNPFIRAASENNIKFNHLTGLSNADNEIKIKSSYMAPTITGEWQTNKGYVPCRIFKNISYGKLGITNSKKTNELFHENLIYNDDTYKLFYDAKERLSQAPFKDLILLMDDVKDNHTYLNRIQSILTLASLTNSYLIGDMLVL